MATSFIRSGQCHRRGRVLGQLAFVKTPSQFDLPPARIRPRPRARHLQRSSSAQPLRDTRECVRGSRQTTSHSGVSR